MAMASPTIAYDLELLTRPPVRESSDCQGWCYGLPPGIAPGQWPLSPHFGYPLQPCFTVRVPESYRTKGASYVALSMFADQQFDEPSEVEAVAELMRARSPGRPADPDLLPFWANVQSRHPMAFPMYDILGKQYVAIWLTEAEFAAPLCDPPDLAGNPLLRRNSPPLWLAKGAARAVFDVHAGSYSGEQLTKLYWYRVFGKVPEIGHDAFAVAIRVREGDPNVGKPPRDHLLHKDELGDYVAPYSEAGKALDLARLESHNHFGGTMFPCQWTPKFSPTYLEIEEHFGGFNFGGGNGQLDLETMMFEWACG